MQVDVKRILLTQVHVLHALILRAIQTRFGGRSVNFLLALCWPLGHIGLLLLIYGALGRAPPIGTSSTMFFATGLTPYMFFNYPSRFMMLGTLQNRALLSFPVVKVMDLIIASAILETVAGCAVILVTAFVLYCVGEKIWPTDPAMAMAALGGMWVLAMGTGIIFSVLSMVVPFMPIAAALFQVVMYITSGILFVPATLPDRAQELLWWNPATHGVQWFREAYYGEAMASEYFPNTLFLIGCGTFLAFFGLMLERFVIRKRVD